MKLRILFLLCVLSPMVRAQLKPDNITFPPIAWLWYSGNFAPDWNGVKINANPPGSHYGLVMQMISLNK